MILSSLMSDDSMSSTWLHNTKSKELFGNILLFSATYLTVKNIQNVEQLKEDNTDKLIRRVIRKILPFMYEKCNVNTTLQ